MARKFKELLAKMPARRRARIRAKTEALISAMSLEELREAQSLTQKAMADMLELDQPAISKLEHRTDTYVSTLRKYIQAMGGNLEIRATFPSGSVLIDQFTGQTSVIASVTSKKPAAATAKMSIKEESVRPGHAKRRVPDHARRA